MTDIRQSHAETLADMERVAQEFSEVLREDMPDEFDRPLPKDPKWHRFNAVYTRLCFAIADCKKRLEI